MAEPGTHDEERVTLATLPSSVPIQTTVHVYEGTKPGPTLYVQAAQHGREINGTETLRRVHERFDLEELSGRLIAVPVANPLTFDRVSYTTPEPLDSVNPNMNRIWPGDRDGSLHERMATRLWEYASEADAIVDLHTGSPSMHPHVVYLAGDGKSRELAEAFGTERLLGELADEEADEEWERRNFAGKLRVAATNEGIPSITPELAHNRVIVEEAVKIGVRGVFDVMRHMEMIPGEPSNEKRPLIGRNHLGRVIARESGFFRADPSRQLGERVSEGTPLGTLYDPASYEVLQEAVADRDGVLYALTHEATVTAGQKLANVAEVVEERA